MKNIGLFSFEIVAIFDILSILEIKKGNTSGNPQLKQNLQEKIEISMSEINNNIGYNFARKIYKSDEYKNLYNANLEVFQAITLCHKQKKLCKEGKIRREDCLLGWELDSTNHKRIMAKQELSKKWFDAKLEEKKIGYE